MTRLIMTIFCAMGICSAAVQPKGIRLNIDEFEYEAPKVEMQCRITYYEPVAEQCSGNPLITANGTRIDTIALRNREIRYCAVSRDVEALFPMGSEIEVFISDSHRWNGVWKIVDRTSSRLTKTIDILSNTDKGGCYQGKISEV